MSRDLKQCRTKIFWSAAVLKLVVLLGAGGLVDPGKASDISSFCKPNVVVRDYLAPLAGFPTAKSFKPSGKLRVGPSALRVFPPRSNLVVVRQDRFEAVGDLEGNALPSKRLGWISVSTLERISTNGLAKDLKKKRLHLPTVKSFDDQQFGLGADVPEGVYRLGVEFQNSQGRRLARYVEYFRAVMPRSDMRLVAKPSQIPAGETAQFRLKNFGSVDASFNYYVQLLNSNGEKVPVEQGVFPTLRPVIRAGHVGECIPFRMPVNTPAGQYILRVRAWDRALQKPSLLEVPIEIASPSV